MVKRPWVCLVLGLGACDATPVAEGPPHLAEAARAELHQIGLDQFLGKAVIKSEEQHDDVTSVTFDPASGPVCIFGAPYMAHLRKTGSDKLMVFLGGGGACWTGFCSATPEPDTGIVPLAPLRTEIAANPFHDYNVLYLPYCDGSVFSGNNDVPDPKGERHFHGRQNLSAGLDLLERLGPMHTVVVGGVSAGAYGTLAATALVRMLYPSAEMLVYDDSGPWLQNLSQTADVEARIKDWRFDQMLPPSCTECAGGRGQLDAFMAWLLKNDDQLRVGMLSFYQDAVIGDYFTKLPGDEYKTLLVAETGKLHAAYPDRVRRFMLAGTAHVVTLYWPNLAVVNNVNIHDWTASLVRGDDTWKDLLEP